MCALLNGRVRKVYPCSQQVLYTIARTGWGSYLQHLSEFEGLSSNYSAATAMGQLAAIDAARAMPDEYMREDVHMSLRVDLQNLADDCVIKWSHMSSFIRDAFPRAEYDTKRLAAGYGYYRSATHQNWDSVKGLMESGVIFANDNATVLTDDGGMPAAFIADLEAIQDSFEQAHQAFLQSREEAKVLRDEKISANNSIYRALIEMFADGKQLFRFDYAVRQQFTLNRVRSLVGGARSAWNGVYSTEVSIGGLVYDVDTGIPIVGARLMVWGVLDGVSVSATTDDDGLLEMTIPGFEAHESVHLEGEFVADGYEAEAIGMEVTAGELYSFDVGLVVYSS